MILYKLISPSGKMYIGQTRQSFSRRLSCHKCRSKSAQTVLAKAIRKYGWNNFKKEVILDKIAEDKIDDLERKYIKECNTLVPNGYNLESGGHKLKKHSSISIEKMKKIQSRKDILQKKNRKGKPLSKETRELMRKVNKMKIATNCLTLKNEYICSYESIHDAGRQTNINYKNIHRAIKHSTTAGGFKWEYSN